MGKSFHPSVFLSPFVKQQVKPPFYPSLLPSIFRGSRGNPSPALSANRFLPGVCVCYITVIMVEREGMGEKNLWGRKRDVYLAAITPSDPGGLCLWRQITVDQCCLAALSASPSRWAAIYEAWYMLRLLCSVNCWDMDSWQAHSKREISNG